MQNKSQHFSGVGLQCICTVGPGDGGLQTHADIYHHTTIGYGMQRRESEVLLNCRSGRKRSRSSEEEGDVSEAEEQIQPVDFHGIISQAVCSYSSCPVDSSQTSPQLRPLQWQLQHERSTNTFLGHHQAKCSALAGFAHPMAPVLPGACL